MSLRCLILEDQAPARRVLETYLARLPACTVVGSVAAPSTAGAILAGESVDLLFLDLGLPQQDGFDFLTRLAKPPVVVVTTAWSARAVEGFTHGVADYLVKPFAFERFRLAVERAEAALRSRDSDRLIAIPVDRGRRELVASRNIRWLSADGDYVQVHTTDRRLLTLGPLARWLEQLPTPPFLRIHRSHVVNVEHLEALEPRQVRVGGQALPVSARHVGALQAAVTALDGCHDI